MPDVQHGSLQPGAASGIHPIHHWAVSSEAARSALAVVVTDIGKVCRQQVGSDVSWWVLDALSSGLGVWKRLDNVGGLLATPINSPTGTVDITDATGSTGDSDEGARKNHSHGHGNRGGGTLHATALGGGSPAAGFMSGADKVAHDGHVSKLAGLPSALTIDTSTVPPANTDAGAAGTGTAVAPINHRHPHGTGIAGGTTHATAIGGGSPAAGFMSGADKVAVDGFPAQIAAKSNRAWLYTSVPGNYQITGSDVNQEKLLHMMSAVAATLTLPSDTTASINWDEPISVIRQGTGVVTITAGAGATIVPANNLRLANQYDMATVVKIAANTWLVKGEAVV